MMSKSRLYSTTLLALRLTKTTAFAPPLPTSPSFSTRLFSTPPTRYLLSYDYVPDVLEKRGPHREGHLGLARAMIEEGVCVSGGPSAVPGEGVPGGALFVFTTKEAAEKFVAEDPYVSNGIVTDHSILEWTVVVGNN